MATLTTAQAAAYLGRSPNTLRGWRCLQVGPPYIRMNGHGVGYDEQDLKKFKDKRRVNPEDLTNARLQKAR